MKEKLNLKMGYESLITDNPHHISYFLWVQTVVQFSKKQKSETKSNFLNWISELIFFGVEITS